MRDKVIVITGASSGIGAELAHQAGRAGAKLVLAARDEDRLLDIAEKYPGSLAVQTNVTVEAACKNLIERTIEHFGRIDVLVNNAGLSMFANFDQIQDLGVLVKDINLGLLDFPALREGQEVYLCWQYGEGEIAFWHEVEAGFAGRQPI